LADNVGKTFDELDPRLRKTFERYSIGSRSLGRDAQLAAYTSMRAPASYAQRISRPAQTLRLVWHATWQPG
jgi:hypothetical protein